MRHSWLRVGAPLAAALLITVWVGAGLVSAQGKPVRINGAIDKLARGKSLAGAIMYDFSLYAAAQFASSDLDFIIIDMEHRGLDFERLAKLNVTGGSVHNIVLNAAFLAVDRNTTVSMPIVLEAAKMEMRKLKKPINEADFRWHEGGLAAV